MEKRIRSPNYPAISLPDAIGRVTALFAELAERFPGSMPNEDLLRNYLLRQGFAPAAVASVIAAYRDTSDMVAAEGQGYDSASSPATQGRPMQPPALISTHELLAKSLISQGDTRQIGQYNFEDRSEERRVGK